MGNNEFAGELEAQEEQGSGYRLTAPEVFKVLSGYVHGLTRKELGQTWQRNYMESVYLQLYWAHWVSMCDVLGVSDVWWCK